MTDLDSLDMAELEKEWEALAPELYRPEYRPPLHYGVKPGMEQELNDHWTLEWFRVADLRRLDGGREGEGFLAVTRGCSYRGRPVDFFTEESFAGEHIFRGSVRTERGLEPELVLAIRPKVITEVLLKHRLQGVRHLYDLNSGDMNEQRETLRTESGGEADFVEGSVAQVGENGRSTEISRLSVPRKARKG